MSRADYSDPEIQQALNDTKSGANGTNWILLGYVPKSDNKLKLVATGNDGLKGMSDQWNDGKVLFALVTFLVNNTRKFAYISWCGEGVVGMKKGLFNNHANDVANLFKGFHAQVNARNEDDVVEQTILEKLRKATGAAYDAGAKNQGSSEAVPQSVSQGKAAAMQSNAQFRQADKSDYNKKSESDQFWNQDKQDVEKTKAQPPKAFNQNDYQKTNEREQFWAQQKQDQGANNSQRPQPAVPAGNASSLKNRFENPPPSNPPPRTAAAPAPRPLAGGGAAPPPRKEAPPPPKPAPAPAAPEPEPEPEPSPAEPEPAEPEPQQQEPEPEPEQVQQEEQQQEEQQTYEEQPAEEPAQEQSSDQQYFDDGSNAGATGSGPAAGQARALYDYDAENPDDLSFKEGEMINILDKSDPSGWWQGELNGVTGFFPSNFVEDV